MRYIAMAIVCGSLLPVAVALAQRGGNVNGKYPAEWWTPAPEEGKPFWEILPQAASPGEVILSKRNELGILSNFAATPFTFRGKRYASVEGFWQMMLYPEGPDDARAQAPGVTWKYTREAVSQMTAFAAKNAGDLAETNMRKMRIDWVTFEGRRMPYRAREKGAHYALIVAAMQAKLEQNPMVREILLKTGDLILRPDHVEEPDAPPEWHYFKIWMEIRSVLQQKQ
ncbi:MAG: NADAR family protein [Bryobacteraceae bacterium]